MDALANKDDKVISGYIKKKCDEKYGPTVRGTYRRAR